MTKPSRSPNSSLPIFLPLGTYRTVVAEFICNTILSSIAFPRSHTMQHSDHGPICTKCQHVLTRTVPVPQSVVPNLIHTNRIPSPLEASLIIKSLSTIDFLQLDNDIAHVQFVLDELLRNRMELDGYCRDHKSILSLIRQFPPELLSHIFLLSLPTLGADSVMPFRRAILLPGQVCKHWREMWRFLPPKLWSGEQYYVRGRE